MQTIKINFNVNEVVAISFLPMGGQGHKDQLCWHYSTSGHYSVKYGYWFGQMMGDGGQIGEPSDLRQQTWWR